MKISYKWLQDYFEEKLPAAEEIAGLLTMHSFEIDSIEAVGDDYVLDVKVMPDRAHDCMSHFGIAKEIGALINTEVKPLEISRSDLKDSPRSDLKTSDFVTLKIADKNKCLRATKRLVKNVKIGPSPEWLADRLNVLGQRSINNVVDIANFVMLETGQPVHTFDFDKINKNIMIRPAEDGEKIKALDGKDYILDSSMLVIADENEALDIAGIKGGFNSSLSNSSKNILLSVCNFEPTMIRRTRNKLGLRTDASDRFEKGISPALVETAMNRLSYLIMKYAEGEVSSDIVEVYPDPQELKSISIGISDIEEMLGVSVSAADFENIMSRLGFQFSRSNLKGAQRFDLYEVTPPPLRLDIEQKADIVEEIGRLYGYEKIPATRENMDQKPKEVSKEFYYSTKIRHVLASRGFSEVYTYAFVQNGEVELMNPIAADKKFLRAGLESSLNESLKFNFNYGSLLGSEQVRIFEIGKVFKHDGEYLELSLGVKDRKKKDARIVLDDALQALGEAFGAELDPLIGDDEAAVINLTELIQKLPEPKTYGDLELGSAGAVKYKKISQYPFIVRDIAVWLPEANEADELYEILKKEVEGLSAGDPYVIDKFQKDGRTSYAYRLIFQSMEKTLTDEEVNKVMEKITLKIKANSGWEVR